MSQPAPEPQAISIAADPISLVLHASGPVFLVFCSDARRLERISSQRGHAQPNDDLEGYADFYGWSEDKARQAAQPEGASFAAYIKQHGFKFV